MALFLMPVLHEPSNPDLYRTVKDRNLEQQYYLIETAVSVGMKSSNFRLSPDVLYSFHAISSMFLEDTPGKIRTGFVHIQNSHHIPPEPNVVAKHLTEYLNYLNSKFDSADMFELAAYAFWRLTWIHPFDGCNGRTARAFCYYIICMKFGGIPPGPQNMLALMSKEVAKSYQLLAECDSNFENFAEPDVTPLADYLAELFLAQLEEEV